MRWSPSEKPAALVEYRLLGLMLIACGVIALRAAWGADEAPPVGTPDAATKEGEPPAALQDNPYLAPDDYSPAELVAYLQKLQRKPDSIRARERFVDAVLNVAERITAAEGLSDEQRIAALLVRFESLHHASRNGAAKAEEQLYSHAAKLTEHPHPEVSAAARFHLLEQRAGQAGELDGEKLAALLDELQEFLGQVTLGEKHLRLASRTVAATNRVEDVEQRNARFDVLGAILSKCSERKVARYGREIAKRDRSGDLSGQKLEIAGATLEGAAFDWNGYRGKVVLVDFWATWCGPCIAELPNVRANYERYHDQGFEVVGISLDQDRDALQAFLEEQKLPWVNLFDSANGNANATKYGVRGIPFPILVDREGKVISTEARGAKLGELLEKALAN